MNKSEVYGVVFLDLKKAFDLVNHNIGEAYQLPSKLEFFAVFQIIY